MLTYRDGAKKEIITIIPGRCFLDSPAPQDSQGLSFFTKLLCEEVNKCIILSSETRGMKKNPKSETNPNIEIKNPKPKRCIAIPPDQPYFTSKSWTQAYLSC
jgi:hypothetical protein